MTEGPAVPSIRYASAIAHSRTRASLMPHTRSPTKTAARVTSGDDETPGTAAGDGVGVGVGGIGGIGGGGSSTKSTVCSVTGTTASGASAASGWPNRSCWSCFASNGLTPKVPTISPRAARTETTRYALLTVGPLFPWDSNDFRPDLSPLNEHRDVCSCVINSNHRYGQPAEPTQAGARSRRFATVEAPPNYLRGASVLPTALDQRSHP